MGEKFKEEVNRETSTDPVMFGSLQLERKASVTYLGDELSELGLSASVMATVSAREAKVKGAIFELKALCEDYRMQVVGGMVGAIDIYETCIVPSLLANSGAWIDIDEKTVKRLDAIQHLFIKQLLHLPNSTPVPSLRAITSQLGMKWRVWQEKCLLVRAIRRQEEGCLAREMLQEQISRGWPGLAVEVTEICKIIGLKDVCREDVEKEDIKEAIFYHHYASMKAEMSPNGQVLEKLRGLVDRDLTSPQDYLKSSCLAEARMAARVQLNMVRCPGNMAGLYRGRMSCEACAPWRKEGEVGPVKTQEHMTVCPAYRFLQQQYGDRMWNFELLTHYFMDLMWVQA